MSAAPGSRNAPLLFDALLSCADQLRSAVKHEVLDPEGLSWTAWQVLALLSAEGDKELRELAAQVHVSKTTASFVVQRLVDRGLATRVVHPEDGRRVIVSASADGRSTALRVRAHLTDASTRAVAGLSPRAITTLRTALA